MRDLEARMDAFAALKGTLAQGPDAVLRAYRAYDDIGMLQYKVYRYPQLQRDTDTRDQAVAGHFQVKVTDLRSKKRSRSISLPRQVPMFLARRMTHLSLEEIGRFRDHQGFDGVMLGTGAR